MTTNQFSNYLGQWIVNDPHDPERCSTINCIDVIESTRTAVFEDGRKVSLFDLDNSNGVYEKMHSIYGAPGVKEELGRMAGSLSSKAYPSPKLGDLSKIGHKNETNDSLRLTEDETHEKIHDNNDTQIQPVSHVIHHERNDNDPVASFISSAIKLSKKSGGKSVIPIKISLELDFDILSIISSAMNLGATDVEILQHIFNEIEISNEYIKRCIFNELLKSPEDVDIAMSEREQTFTETLNEELNKHDENNKDNDRPNYQEV